MKKIISMAALFLVMLIAGCAPNRVDYNKQSINLALGMSKPQVSQIMGMPKRTDVNTERERWIYWNPVLVGFTPIDNEQLANDRLVVTFVDGKVTRWGQQTIVDDAMEMSQKTTEGIIKATKN